MKIIVFSLTLYCFVLASNGKAFKTITPSIPPTNGMFPYQVSVQMNGHHHCGGALISKSHVLTAAHCVSDIIQQITTPEVFATLTTVNVAKAYSKALTVEVGSVTIGQGQTYHVKRISYDHNYVENRLYLLGDPNYLAVLTLTTPVSESDFVKPIALPTSMSELADNTEVIVTSFAKTSPAGAVSNILNQLVQNIVNEKVCSDKFKDLTGKAIPSSEICAQNLEQKGHTVCGMDSGSPLAKVDLKDGLRDAVLVGIVHAGGSGCNDAFPDLHVKVSHFIPYINYEMTYDNHCGNEQLRSANHAYCFNNPKSYNL